MRILLVSKFLHHVGGVETYLRWQAWALAGAGHEVALLGMTPPVADPLMTLPDVPLFLTPERTFEAGAPGRLRSAASSVYSSKVAHVFRDALTDFKPDVVHFHGTCYQLTPAVFRVSARERRRAVLTAHEYKLVCANQRLVDDRHGAVCTACVGRSTVAKSVTILRHSCVKGSIGPSVLGALEMPLAVRYWNAVGGTILAPSRFMADMINRDGHVGRAEYLEYPWPVIRAASDSVRDTVLYMARLAPEKGIRLLLEAWMATEPKLPGIRLRIAGRGSEETWARDFVADHKLERVDFLGALNQIEIEKELDRAYVTVHPSAWFDNSPLSVRESLCAGVPALVSELGGTPELLGQGCGAVLPASDVTAWSRAIIEAVRAGDAATESFLEDVRIRWFGEAEHLERLHEVYGRTA